jgi:3-hydroxybutyryl-CoA dehydrogenase
MGQGIAVACLIGGHRVAIVSSKEATVSRGMEQIADGRYGLRAAARRGKLKPDDVEQLMAMLSGTTELEEGVAGADFVIESVPENRQLKCELLAAAESAAGPKTVLASNTSSIMIAELTRSLVDPSRLIGTHWFYPANVMKLVEVGRGDLTSEETCTAALEFLGALGKHPVVVGDSPGFFTTRFVNVWVSEAIRLVELGIAGPAEIDEMVTSGLGWPMGVFELLDDTASFESWYHAQEYLHETLGDRYAVPALARKVLSAGYLGDPQLKPGSRGGWYDFLSAARRTRTADS